MRYLISQRLTRPQIESIKDIAQAHNFLFSRKLNSGILTECSSSNPSGSFSLGFGQSGCKGISPINLGRYLLYSPGSDTGGLGQCCVVQGFRSDKCGYKEYVRGLKLGGVPLCHNISSEFVHNFSVGWPGDRYCCISDDLDEIQRDSIFRSSLSVNFSFFSCMFEDQHILLVALVKHQAVVGVFI